MKRGVPSLVDTTQSKAEDRRSFLRDAAVAGLAVTTGGLAVSQTRGGGSPRVVGPRQPVAPSAAESALHLQGPITLVTPTGDPSGRAALAALRRHEPVRAPLTPSPKGELLKAISAQPEGASALAALGVTPTGGGGATPFSTSTALALLLAADPLAKAYAQGITLTPTGCEYAPGITLDAPPLLYYTQRATVGTATGGLTPPGLTSLRLKGEASVVPQRLLTVYLSGAGTEDITLPYLFEVDFEWAATAIDTILQGAAVAWAASSKGTYTALVTMQGGKWQYTMSFDQKTGLSLGYWGMFNWLRVTAV
jgi:hypothetical protein